MIDPEDASAATFYAGMGLPAYGYEPMSYPAPAVGSSGVVQAIEADPTEEYLAGSPAATADEYRTLADDVNTLVGELSYAVQRAMLRDPTAKSSFDTLIYGVLSGGVKLTPAVKAKPASGPGDPEAEPDPDAELAEEICGFCQRSTDRLDEHILLFLAEMMRAMVHRHKVAERVLEYATTGPDAGRLILCRLPRKPRWAYRFRVDYQNHLEYLRCATVENTDAGPRFTWVDIPAEKLVIATWSPEDGDPRGNSILDSIYETWVLKRRLIPNWYKGLKQFGSPSLFGTTHEGAEDIPARNPETGEVLTGSDGKPLPPLSPQVAMKKGLQKFFESGSIMVGPWGSNIKVIESTRDGAATEKVLERCDRDITRGILLQVRATMESRFGSKADSQTGQDILGVFVRFIRLWLCAMLDASVYHPLVEANWGDEVADRLSPNVSLGEVEHQDFAKAAAAIAALFQSSYFTEGQLAETDARLGLPIREAGAVRVGPQSMAPGTPDDPEDPQEDTGTDPNPQDPNS